MFQAWLQQPGVEAKKKGGEADLIQNIDDIKVFKKLIRTHNNVLVVFVKKGNYSFWSSVVANVTISCLLNGLFLCVNLCGHDTEMRLLLIV